MTTDPRYAHCPACAGGRPNCPRCDGEGIVEEVDELPCTGYECCGCCPNHPQGKPWGWNWLAWNDHYETECAERVPTEEPA